MNAIRKNNLKMNFMENLNLLQRKHFIIFNVSMFFFANFVLLVKSEQMFVGVK